METNSTSKKQPIKKQRLSVGLARVSSPSNAIQTTDSNTQDELNGVPDNKNDKNIIENTKMVENDAKETDKDNSADSDKELSSRGLKRKADDTENDQITNENEMPENSLPEDTAADKSETEALPSEELVQITQSVKKSKPAGRRRSKPLTMKKKTSKPKMSPAKKLILNEQLDTTDDNKLQIDEDDITEKDMTEGDEENKPDVKEIEDNENKTDTKIKENIEEQGDGEKSDKNQDEENNSEVTSTMDVDHAEITSPVSAISRLSQKSVRANRNNSPAAHLVKKPKIVPDLSNPAYLKPFQHGWKRELVYRATTEANGKRNGDIYYYTPAGKKVRSMREVAENLKNKELTLEDFTFFKEPLGINDPLIEIIRDAKIKTPGGTAPSAVKKTPKLKKEPKVSLDASGSPVVTPKASKASKPAPTHIKVKVSGRLNLSGNRNSPKADKKRNSDTTDLEMGMLPPGWDSPKKVPAKQIKPNAEDYGAMNATTDMCSISCAGYYGIIPSVQCDECLCLFHPNCLVVRPSSGNGTCCQNCYKKLMKHMEPSVNMPDEMDPTVPLPPLTPIDSIKSHAPLLSTPPKLHRLPRKEKNDNPSPDEGTNKQNKSSDPVVLRGGKFVTYPKLVKVSNARANLINNSKSLVGSVTTWLPPSSTVQMASSYPASSNDQTPIVQEDRTKPAVSQAMLGGKNYVVVHKHNIVSFHPNESASTATEVSKPASDTIESSKSNSEFPGTASLGPDTVDAVLPDVGDSSENINLICDSLDTESNKETVKPDPPLVPSSVLSVPFSKPEDGFNSTSTASCNRTETPTAVEKSPVKTKRSANKAAAIQLARPENERNQFMQHFFMNISAGYNALLQVFQYLKVQELLRAGKVCRMWRDLANHPSLWKIVRMKNSQVYDWDALTDSLIRHGTQTLDLRKMLLLEKNDDFWTQFSSSIGRAESLTRIELCRCPATVVEELSKSNPNLEVINAVTIRCETLDLSTFNNLTNLQELRLKSQKGMTLNSDLSVFKKFTNLKHLSLTSVKSLGKQNVDVVGELINLESLELGECSGFSDSFGTDIISKLQKLKKLRLEKDPGSACTDDILKAVSENPKIEQLELINFEVKMGFDEALAKCTNLKKFLIIPTYICQSATTNHMLLKGIIQLSNTLSHFIWGVTLELLRVTELFVDQYDKNSKKEIEKKNSGSVENIPVLKPVPFMVPAKDKPTSTDNAIAKENPQVEILPLVILQKLLCENLPNTRVKILKIPFHATWRQSIHDSTQ